MSTDTCGHVEEIRILRTELKNLRNQVRGLRAQHVKDMARLRDFTEKISSDSSSPAERNPDEVRFRPIGKIKTWHATKNGTPRQPAIARKAGGIIDLQALKAAHSGYGNPGHALENLPEFSHVWLLFHFHENGQKPFKKAKVAPPRLKGRRVGLFSTRSPHRPNPIGLSLARVVKVEDDRLHVEGVDLLDGTPILDIKPYIPKYDAPQPLRDDNGSQEESVATVPDWVNSDANNLRVLFSPRCAGTLGDIDGGNLRLATLAGSLDLKQAIVGVLSADPRSNYRREKCSDRLYFFSVDNIKVTCWFDVTDNGAAFAEVLKMQPV